MAPPCSGPGNLRADYVLPSKDLRIRDGGVFWPVRADPLSRLTGPGFPVPTSDHRQVWVDVRVPGHGATATVTGRTAMVARPRPHGHGPLMATVHG